MPDGEVKIVRAITLLHCETVLERTPLSTTMWRSWRFVMVWRKCPRRGGNRALLFEPTDLRMLNLDPTPAISILHLGTVSGGMSRDPSRSIEDAWGDSERLHPLTAPSGACISRSRRPGCGQHCAMLDHDPFRTLSSYYTPRRIGGRQQSR